MQALGAQERGEWRSVLQLQTLKRPVPGPTECLVRVAFADVNPVDLHKLQGQNNKKGQQAVQKKDPLPTILVPGYAGSGIIVERGGEASSSSSLVPTDFALNARVAFLVNPTTQNGAYAELCVVDFRAMALVPDTVTLQAAGIVPLAGCTAYESLVKLGLGPRANVSSWPTDSTNNKPKILIVGAAGGVGSWAILLLQAWHGNALEIICTASLQEAKAWCQQLDTVRSVQCIGHDEIASLGGGPKGSVDFILCLTEPRAPIFDALVEVIKPRGCLCLVGSGPALQSLNVGFLFFKSCTLQMETVFCSFRSNFAHICPGEEIAQILALLASGAIAAAPFSPTLSKVEKEQGDWTTMPAQENSVLDMIATGHTQGKLFIKIAKDLAR